MSRTNTLDHVWMGTMGLAMGLVLARAGFSDWGEVHRMFTFADRRLLFTFAGAVVVAAVGFQAFGLAGRGGRRRVVPANLVGGALFGAGWALCGACPSISLVQLGEGRIAAAWTILGIAAGTWLCERLKPRGLMTDDGGCGTF